MPGSSGLYGVRGGVALGLDQGPDGDAWGYDVARQRVVWTTPRLPWPHYFVDLSGIGGSADAGEQHRADHFVRSAGRERRGLGRTRRIHRHRRGRRARVPS